MSPLKNIVKINNLYVLISYIIKILFFIIKNILTVLTYSIVSFGLSSSPSDNKIIIGEDTDRNVYFKRDEIESEFSAGIVLPLDNGDVVYSKKENDTETWFYNDIPISISVRGKDSKIYNSIIKYTRTDSKESPNISYFMLKGKEYNGIVLESFCKGYIIWLENGSILSAPYNFTLVHPRFEHNCFYANDNYEQERTGNFLRLFYTHRLAGRD